jgi:hypothetical protein
MSVCNAPLRRLKKYARKENVSIEALKSGSRRQKVVWVRSQPAKTLVEEWGLSLFYKYRIK